MTVAGPPDQPLQPPPSPPPSLPTLRDTVDRALDEAAGLLAAPGPRVAGAALAGALSDLKRHRARWDGRMRVAVVGKVSTGKSTLVNALLGEELAKTAVKETTAVVTWLQHAERERELFIYYKDHPRTPPRRVEPPTAEALAALTAHRDGLDGGFDDGIDYALFRHPSKDLDAFDIIDTPGLSSVRGDDSENTLRHLSPRVDTADAMVFVFDRGPHADTDEMLARFQHGNETGQTEISPLTAIGVLTRVELNWDPGQPLMTAAGRLAVLDQGKQVTARLMADPRARKLFYGVQPIASKIGAAAGTCTEQDFAALAELAGLSAARPGALAESLVNARRFTRDPVLAAIPPDQRAALYRKLTGCGITLACHVINAEGTGTREALCERLRHHSGLSDFRDLLVTHFGDRADLIKLVRLIERARQMQRDHRPLLSSRPLVPFDRATRMITTLTQTETVFAEADALRALYDKRLTFSDSDVGELRLLFGDIPGARTIAERLGRPGAPPGELAARARARKDYWRSQADVGHYHGDTLLACHALANTYNRIWVTLTRPGMRPATAGK
jgi:GTPase SAR1 family protein